MEVKRWKDGVAFFGGNAMFYHMMCLGLTKACGPGEPPLDVLIDPDSGGTDRLRAYYLLENVNGDMADFTDGITITLSDGPRRLLEDGRLEGMRPGAPGQSVKGLFAFAQAREHLRGGRFEEASTLIARTRAECLDCGLTGQAVLFEGLEGERLARLGRWDEAVQQCSNTAHLYPAYAQEFPLLAGFYRYLQGDYAAARDAWLGNPGTIHIGANKHWEAYTYAVYASLLMGEPAGRIEAMIASYQANMPEGNYWRRYLDLQKGWIPLLHGDPSSAYLVLRASLEEGGFEHHAAGYFLASILAGTYDPREMSAYAGAVGGNPLFLQWIAAVGAGREDSASRLWITLKDEAFSNQEVALMVPVLDRLRIRLNNN
jgi:hypothetical protein